MKIALAQIRPAKGDVERNILLHQRMIEGAIKKNADIIFFPELSLSGYEPQLAQKLASETNDPRLQVFQTLADQHNISIGLSMPVRSEKGIYISMLFFQARQAIQVYHKQRLHTDELPYFIKGNQQLLFDVNGTSIAPAICYESLQMAHADHAIQLGGQIYLASVAKAQKGIEKAIKHYPQVAQTYGIPVLMVNSIGPCDDFVAAGQSGVWFKNGTASETLDVDQEGLLIYNTLNQNVTIVDWLQ